jgi:predicted signal transduction protein with EAL and GGDEF domain
VFVTASIGIALGGSDRDLPGLLLRNADLAMYQAKDTGKARYEMFEPNMNERALERLKLENELRRALEKNELRVYYQPKLQLM